MNDDNEKKGFNAFIKEYGGAVIGGLIALILCFTEFYKTLVLAGIFVGNYVQKNKPNVKEKLKQLIDKF